LTDEEFEREQQGRLERRLDATVLPAARCLFDGYPFALLPVIAFVALPVLPPPWQ
jgi:hypothetical protein